MSSKKLIELTYVEARAYFLKNSSYFNSDLPQYINFEPLLNQVSTVLDGKNFQGFKNEAISPESLESVNYKLITNKDGKIAWRPLELIHPVIYVSLVNLICNEENWKSITERMTAFEGGVVKCCSSLVVSLDCQSDKASQIISWWQKIEQQSLKYSLEFSHILHTDVTDCYGSLYTHSIPWALHGKPEAKINRKNSLLGNRIDSHIQAGRHGQTNGISQGSVLMDFIAEIVLGYVDEQINKALSQNGDDVRILRYRDDYRIFTNNDDSAEVVLKTISDSLLSVGMRLSASKTYASKNVVAGSIKPDKLAAIELQDIGFENAKTVQKQLLRLHSFGQKFPNSGALKRLLSDFRTKVAHSKEGFHDLAVQVAIATDIAFASPSTLPAVAAILSCLISKSPSEEKKALWDKVSKKLHRVPYNGYLEIWLQRVILTCSVDVWFESEESLCKITNGEDVQLWDSTWISSEQLIKALRTNQIIVSDPRALAEVMESNEIDLFNNGYDY